ncbi:MAG: hypothetical protein C4343_07265 [Chloroflexota bacterium]
MAEHPPREEHWYLLPAAVAVVSRCYSAAILLALHSIPGMRRSLLTVWDAAWYLRIADSGYHGGVVHGGHDFAFFPAWPLLIKIASLGIFPLPETGFVLANGLFVVAAVLIWRVLADRLDAATATAGVVLLAFAPSAYVFSLPYAEALFLVAAGSYFFVRPESPWRLAATAFAMFTRIAGAGLVSSALARAAMTRGRARLAALAAAAAGCLAFAVWWGFIAVLTQKPTGFLLGSPSWAGGSSGLRRLAVALLHPTLPRLAWLGFVGLVTVGALLLVKRDRELAVFSLTVLALSLLPGGTVNSMPRYALSAFPAYAGLALGLDRLDRRLVRVLAVLFALAQIGFAAAVLLAPPHGAAP